MRVRALSTRLAVSAAVPSLSLSPCVSTPVLHTFRCTRSTRWTSTCTTTSRCTRTRGTLATSTAFGPLPPPRRMCVRVTARAHHTSHTPCAPTSHTAFTLCLRCVGGRVAESDVWCDCAMPRQSDLLVMLMDNGRAYLCSVTEHMTLELARVDVPIPKKRAVGSGHMVRSRAVEWCRDFVHMHARTRACGWALAFLCAYWGFRRKIGVWVAVCALVCACTSASCRSPRRGSSAWCIRCVWHRVPPHPAAAA